MFVQSFKKIMVKLRKGAAKRIRECQTNNLCLACKKPLDNGGRIIRGVHESCRKLLEKHYDDLNECVADGKLLEAKPGRKPSNPVTIEALGDIG